VNSSTSTSSSDKILEINFQYPIATAQPKRSSPATPVSDDPSTSSFNPKLESMRSIKSKDYFDPPRFSNEDTQTKKVDDIQSTDEAAKAIREQLVNNKNLHRDSLGYRTFEHLVPQWWKMTKKEIVDVLVQQICYIQRRCVSSLCIYVTCVSHVYDNLDGLLALDKPYGLPTIGKSMRVRFTSDC
jgi:hypothetical protein